MSICNVSLIQQLQHIAGTQMYEKTKQNTAFSKNNELNVNQRRYP